MISQNQLIYACVLTALTVGNVSSAVASTAPVADLPSGQMLGVGLSGVSWDYGWNERSLGLELRNTAPLPGGSSRFLAGARGTWRWVEIGDLKVSGLAGVQYDPGVVGSRAYLIPDLGLSVAYGFRFYQWPFTLRFNVSLTEDQGGGNGIWNVTAPAGIVAAQPVGNFFQRLVLGPNTSLGLGFAATDRYEVMVGGGTLIGLRVRY